MPWGCQCAACNAEREERKRRIQLLGRIIYEGQAERIKQRSKRGAGTPPYEPRNPVFQEES